MKNELKTYQQRVDDWMQACFGPQIAADRLERSHRFVEESLELAQACGMPKADAYALVDYVYARPIGDKHQESGGVSVTHAALCSAHAIDIEAAAETELARVWTVIDKIRIKQAAKPRNLAVPLAMAIAGRRTTTEEIHQQAIDIADEAMAERIHSEGILLSKATLYGSPAYALTNEHAEEVHRIDDAESSLIDAVDWLVKRGQAQVQTDMHGEYVVLTQQQTTR